MGAAGGGTTPGAVAPRGPAAPGGTNGGVSFAGCLGWPPCASDSAAIAALTLSASSGVRDLEKIDIGWLLVARLSTYAPRPLGRGVPASHRSGVGRAPRSDRPGCLRPPSPSAS